MNPETFSLATTDFEFSGQSAVYHGKVRDVYTIGEKLVMVATDRISAFDHILPRAIPYKGQVLNQLAVHFLEATKDIVPNWLMASPDANVSVGKAAIPFKVEMVIRGFLTGHALREYHAGKRVLCGVNLPDGLRPNEGFDQPIITPTTKASEGHDEDISKEDIISSGIVSAEDYSILEKYTRALFQRGSEMAAKRGLILVDTKYEFGKVNGEIILIDEIHTPDSSRYFLAEDYKRDFGKDVPMNQLSKEFVREWLITNGFQGKDGQKMPEMPDDFVWSVSDRYIDLYEKVTGKPFEKADTSQIKERVKNNIEQYLKE
ncbi:MAG: phosphoribosylaminoimidazolesuccinocarboxamide synthase [Saprospiraceae bacterium]|nr:phosphoribosylaminoimidazolesuccinocarboxamide synthase [Saprospiraceae bacterium]